MCKESQIPLKFKIQIRFIGCKQHSFEGRGWIIFLKPPEYERLCETCNLKNQLTILRYLDILTFSPSTLKTRKLTQNFFSLLAILRTSDWKSRNKKNLKVNHSDNYVSYQIVSNGRPWSNFNLTIRLLPPNLNGSPKSLDSITPYKANLLLHCPSVIVI